LWFGNKHRGEDHEKGQPYPVLRFSGERLSSISREVSLVIDAESVAVKNEKGCDDASKDGFEGRHI
jgi:hypothetical protein